MLEDIPMFVDDSAASEPASPLGLTVPASDLSSEESPKHKEDIAAAPVSPEMQVALQDKAVGTTKVFAEHLESTDCDLDWLQNQLMAGGLNLDTSTLMGACPDWAGLLPGPSKHSATPVGAGASFSAPAYNQAPSSYGPVGTLPSYSMAPQYSSQPSQPPVASLGGSQQSGSQSGNTTPAQRKSPTMDAGVQVSVPPTEKRQSPRGSQRSHGQQGSAGPSRQQQQQHGQQHHHQQHGQQHHHQQHGQQHHHQQTLQQQSRQGGTQQQRGRRGGIAGGSSGAPSGRPRQGAFRAAKPKEPLKFDREYDFEQANAEFQELENKLAQTKISDEKKDDSGTETQVGDNHEDDDVVYYDKNKSFFDNISCEAIERSKGVQRIDWRQERKLNHETFGISANNWMRRNAWRGRGGYWRGGRGGQRGGQRGGPGGNRGGARPRNGAVPRDGWSSVPRTDATSSADAAWP
uniref:Putative trailer hitch n=1 Tax=Amblyomma cajennense TaxID=34607 RepID=A0A023FCC4_AMBCJ